MRFTSIVSLLVLMVLLPGAASLYPVSFVDEALTYGIEFTQDAHGDKYITLLHGDGQGHWQHTYIVYELYFDHGWFSEWNSIYREEDRLYVLFLGSDYLVLIDPDTWWWSDYLYRVKTEA